jgi:hypothetical protein
VSAPAPGTDAVDFAAIWDAVTAWGHAKPRRLDFGTCWVQLYMGAMEIPMVALHPGAPAAPAGARVAAWAPLLERLGLVLDCVTEDVNYKLNRREGGEYVGRLLPDALKLHAVRVLDLGPDGFEALCRAYLRLRDVARESAGA